MQRVLLGLVLTQLACGPTLPATPNVEVTLARVAIDGQSRIEVTLANRGTAPVYYNGCGGIWLEIETVNGWVRATGDACIPGVRRTPLEIAAGQVRRRDFSIVTAHAVRGAAQVSSLGGTSTHITTSESIDTTP